MTSAEAGRDRLEQLLRTLGQGDLISLGAVTIVGAGPSAAAAAAHAEVGDDTLWSVTVESEAGWYVVLSQDCDIVRDPAEEPCIVVCPLVYVPASRWHQLRSGPYSPRHFPYPDEKGLRPDAERWPVASLLYVSSVDKTALLHESVRQLSPLTGPQRSRFGRWVARRFGRTAHDDLVERDVLSAAGARIRSLSKSFAKAGSPTDVMRLVAATEEWYVEATDQNVKLHAVLSEASANAAGLWDNRAGDWHHERIVNASKNLRKDLAKRLPAGGGYVLNVNATSLDRVPSSQYVSSWAVWTLEGDDALASE
ncbi:MAG: hypothetical protein WD010_05270 [Nitriliruptor sp.]|uniref:hypothetical protein n=1 Tax=Nitriliruptor sp. TaxID=2448056 RepID=UPI0034A02F7B